MSAVVELMFCSAQTSLLGDVCTLMGRSLLQITFSCFRASDRIQFKHAFVCVIRIDFSLPLLLVQMKKAMVVTAEPIQVCWGKEKAEFQVGFT